MNRVQVVTLGKDEDAMNRVPTPAGPFIINTGDTAAAC